MSDGERLVLMEAYLKAFGEELEVEGVDMAVVAAASTRAADRILATVKDEAARIRREEGRN